MKAAKAAGVKAVASAGGGRPVILAINVRNHRISPDGSPAPAKPSKKPFFMFLIALFGLPYLMGKLIK
jgi:peroxin-13